MTLAAGHSSLPLADRFRRWAGSVVGNDSPLYHRLASAASGDPEVLALVADVSPLQPVPLLLFAAVQYLLFAAPDDPLAAWYPAVSGDPPPAGDPYPDFRRFALDRAGPVRDLATTRTTQTNETGRAAVLLPAYGLIAARTGRPLALIEVGASGGLNLLFDRYLHRYGAAGQVGGPSPVVLECTPRGTPPPLPAAMPAVAFRRGIDLHPRDVTDPDDVAWMRALIWPDQIERHRRFLAACELARRSPPPLVAGDAPQVLPAVAAAAPGDSALVVAHTQTVVQFPTEARHHLITVLRDLSRHRTVHQIAGEWLTEEGPVLELTTYRRGAGSRRRLARYHAHGAWIEWVGPTA